MVARPLQWTYTLAFVLGATLGCSPAESPRSAPAAPAETPVETPAETPVETPAETPVETPVATPTETPVETPAETSTPEPSVTPEATPAMESEQATATLPLLDDALTTPAVTPQATAAAIAGDLGTMLTLPLNDDYPTTGAESLLAGYHTDSDTSAEGIPPSTPHKLARAGAKKVLSAKADVIEQDPAARQEKRTGQSAASSSSGTRERTTAAADKSTGKSSAKSGKVPAETMSLRAFLLQELGPKKFHVRSKWAGGGFEPVVVGKRVWKPLGSVKFLTIHHADGVPDEHPARMIRNIFTGHTTPGGRLNAPDIGYHFFVDRNGEVWEARDASKLGTHVGSKPAGLNNTGNIGICGLGTFRRERPPRKMTEGIANLSVLIAKYYGRSLTVRGHRDWLNINDFHPYGGCDCPGHLDAAVKRARTDIQAAFAKPKPEKKTETSVAASKADKSNKSDKASSETSVKTAMVADDGN